MKKGELRARRNALEAFWRQGLKGRKLLQQHTQLIDAYIRHYHEKCPAELRSRIALVALGGYGRCEQFPFSDVDILLLHEPEVTEQLSVITETIFYPLWDAGLEVGHGVRTIEACLADADQDFFFQVALLDGRFLCGEERLFQELENLYQQGFVEGQRRVFLENMISSRQQRQHRFGMNSYLLEPHIKESRGGLRDIHAMLWTAKALFGLSSLEDLQESGLLTTQEHLDFTDAWDHLVKIRNRLHYLSSRKNDQLYFEYQEEMATDLQFRNTKDLLGVEQFMRDLYGHLQKVAIATDLFFEHVEESLTPATSARSSQTMAQNRGIAIRNGHIHLELDGSEQLQKKPYLLMQLFAQAAKTGLPIHYRTKRLVTANLHLIDDRARVSKRMAKHFLAALTEAAQPLPVLTTMLETGLLAAYIPELGKISSLAQHDVYHIYTVDRHLLQTVAETAILREKDAPLFATVATPNVLFLAALLHDIGKGQGGNHAVLGAEQASVIGKRMGLTDHATASLGFLIEYHLFLTDTALRRDLEDEPFIIRCAGKIADQDRLKMLYLLSIADARATGPTAWNDWKAALLLELYQRITNLLGHTDLVVTPDQNPGVHWMRSRIKAMLEPSQPHAITETLNHLPDDYLLSFSPEEVLEHLAMHRRLKGQKALLAASGQGDTLTIRIMAKDRPGLLAKICGILALHNLTVLAAQIWTWSDNTAVDVIKVRSQTEDSTPDHDWTRLENDLNRALANRLALAHRLVDKRQTTTPSHRRMGVRPKPRVQINNTTSDGYTVIEVFADDHPGLLYDITRCLAELDINIHQAKIATEKERLVDVFYVLDSEGNKIEDTPFCNEINKALLHVAANN
ncbi:[protein-PII] uridylyltransferase [Thermodesulfobacteriota bacterium]